MAQEVQINDVPLTLWELFDPGQTQDEVWRCGASVGKVVVRCANPVFIGGFSSAKLGLGLTVEELPCESDEADEVDSWSSV